MNVLALLVWLVAAGVTQPGGAATTVYIYDDTHGDAGGDGSYSFSDIKAALDILNPGQVDIVSYSLGGRTVYDFFVFLQVGDTTTNAASTTLQATSVDLYFEINTAILYRATQTSSWFTNFGTKVGSGNGAGGKNGVNIFYAGGLSPTWRGTIKWYDSKYVHNGIQGSTWQPITSSGSEMIACSLLNTSTGNFSPGSPAFLWDNLYNVEIAGAPGVALVVNIGAAAAERVSLSATSPTAFFNLAVANLSFKDWKFNGTPSSCDLRFGSSAATNWKVINPRWSQNGPKFAQVGAGTMVVANGAKEYWLYNTKVTLAGGTSLAGIPVKVTDTTGAVQVDTTTDANGRASFGSGLTANGVIVMDHYTVAGVYTQRHRSPFLVEVNAPGATAPRNTSYGSYRYYLYWPGYEGVTTSAGTFEDVNDVIPLEFAAGPGGTSWIEDVAS